MGKDVSYARGRRAERAPSPPTCRAWAWSKGDRVAVMMPNVPQYPIAVAGDPARRPGGGQRQPALHAARTRAPAQGFGRQGDRHHGELRRHAAAVHARPRRSSTWCWPRWATCSACSRARWSTTWCATSRRWCRPSACRARCASTTRSTRARARTLQARASAPTTSRCCSTPAAPPACRKGAVLLHRNVIANVLQSEAWNQPVMKKVPAGEQPTSVCALPLYHIFAFTVNMMLGMRTGGKLHPDPESARPAGGAQGAVEAHASTASRRSTRCSTAWRTTPTSAPSTGAT